MLNIFDYNDHIKFIKDAFENKKAKSKRRPSLRSIAKKIDISIAYLSKILNSKMALSTDAAIKICDWLELRSTEKEFLLLLLKLDHEKDEEKKHKIRSEIDLHVRAQYSKPVDDEFYDATSSKNCKTILVLMTGKYSSVDANDISKLLNLSVETSNEILDLLEKCKLIEKFEKKYRRIDHSRLFFNRPIPTAKQIAFHKEILLNAINALDNITKNSPIGINTILLLDEEQIPKIKVLMEDFFKNVSLISEQSKSRDQVFSLGTQLVQLTKP